ncbi:hypothetical protein [Campylobacter geochelonis]|nr:hypothetical protein [Campylobacter geochelonis]CZE46645.1 Uncharacterised protein [Campylobacter geochelonis]
MLGCSLKNGQTNTAVTNSQESVFDMGKDGGTCPIIEVKKEEC